MRENEIFSGANMKADDLLVDEKPTEPVVTIIGIETVEFGDGKERKRKLTFKETDKGLILNKTNWKAIAKFSRLEDDEDWSGIRIQLIRKYVEFQGDTVAAIRILPPGGWEEWEKAGPKTEAPTTKAPPADDDGLPF